MSDPRKFLLSLRQVTSDTRNLLYATRAELNELRGEVGAIVRQLTEAPAPADPDERLASLTAQAATDARLAAARHEDTMEAIRLLAASRLIHRERLAALRTSGVIDRVLEDPNPLVSVVIPTLDRARLLCERSIPSALNQGYENVEVIVVGDSAPESVRIAVEGIGDPRVRFFNRPYRGPYPRRQEAAWRDSGTPPFNDGLALARGSWIAPLDDDDAFLPGHIERLLARARRDRLELAYCRFRQRHPDGTATVIGSFPPASHQIGLQTMLYMRALTEIFQLEQLDAVVGLPNDWGYVLRMLEAGVRVGMVDEPGVDYYPSQLWSQDAGEQLAEAPPEWQFIPGGFGPLGADGWSTPAVADAYRAKWPSFVAATTGTGPLGIGHEVVTGAEVGRSDIVDQNAVLVIGHALARAAAEVTGERPVRVLDWGGALGHHHLLARRLHPSLKLDYHCVELPAVAAAGRELQPEVVFHETSDTLSGRFDLVLASNALQYERDWPARLRALTALSGRWLLLTRVPLQDGPASYAALQRAHAYGYESEYVGWVFSRAELLSAATTAGLSLEREFALLGPIEIAGAPNAPTHAGFLFRAPEASA